MTGINQSRFLSRVIAVRKARDAAKNPEFKQLWHNILSKLLLMDGENNNDTIH